MSPSTNLIELINTESQLVQVVSRLSRAAQVAVDLESNGFFRYYERICLVQLATDKSAYIIDPLAIDDMRPLGELLGDGSVEKIFHSSDYDLRSLDRDWGFRVNNLFDTGIASAFLGSDQLGLKSVVREFAGVELTKPKKLQRSDWTIRPLSREALSYAANDVLYLPRVREALSERLEEMSRLGWAKEEFERLENVRHTPADRESAFLKVKGSKDLDARGLAILQSLFRFREREAKYLDRPPFKVAQDYALVQLSSDPRADLSSVKGLGRLSHPAAVKGLKAAINEGLRAEPVSRPKPMRPDETLAPVDREKVETRFQSLKAWRTRLGLELGLNPGLLWPIASLKLLAQCPGEMDSQLVGSNVRSWQKREFGEMLRGVLATLD